MISTTIVAYLALFLGASFAFVFAAMLVGWFLRPRCPTPIKREIYECGERTIGSSQVRFDLRFYVVALVFLIFDVEVAFFFPWATVFGLSTRLMNSEATELASSQTGQTLSPAARAELRALGVRQPESSPLAAEANARPPREDARRMAIAAMAEIGVFFGVLLVGFAYVWYRGDLNWVRAIGRPSPARLAEQG